MIPTIEQIVKDLAAGTVTQEQALAWLNQHLKLEYERGQNEHHDPELGDGR